MNREQFKRQMKASVHHGTGRTRRKSSMDESADIERKTSEFLASGGNVQELPSEQRRPVRTPAFNGGEYL